MQSTRRAGTAVVLVLASCAAVSIAAHAATAVERVERGNLVMEDVPSASPALAGKLGRYLDTRQAVLRDWTPEGALIVATRFGEVDQLHVVDQPLGMRRQITYSPDPVGLALHSPGGKRRGLVFLKDVGGNENAQIWYQPLQNGRVSGEPRLITDGRSLNGSVRWSNDGTRIAYYSNQRSPASYDVYVADPQSAEPPRIVVESGGNAWYPLDWSPDDRKLLLWNVVNINDSSLWIADLATGVTTPVDPAPHAVAIATAAFARDGKGVYLVSDRNAEFRQLRYVSLDGGASRVLTARIPWDIEEFALSPDGRYLAWLANEDGYSRLSLLDVATGKDLAAPQLPDGTISILRFDPTGSRLAFSLETARQPRDIFVYDVPQAQLTRWTQSEVGSLDREHLVDAQLVHFPTFDLAPEQERTIKERVPQRRRVRMIPAFVHRPAGAGPHPVLISIHGGPESQYRPEFDAFVQFAVNELGYAVIAPNVRGSSGYGKTFLHLDNGMRREDAVRDVGELLTWIGRQSYLDAKRVIVMGGSYGGYMALASLASYGDRISGGVDMVGISNYITFLANTSEYRRDLRRAEYGDERNARMREFLHRISPLTNAERIRRPLLIVQGLNDPRVPASESEQMVARIRAIGGDVWYLLAKDEGHGFKKKQNRDVYWQTLATFLERHGTAAGDSAMAADDTSRN